MSETGPRGAISSRYDAGGRRTRLTWPDGYFVTYDYRDTGEMTAIREGGAASGPGVLATFGYDHLGRRTSLTRGNGTTTTYAHDPSSRLSSLTHDLAGAAHDVTFGFTYNPASQIASRSASNDAYAHAAAVEQTGYGVNGLNQLTTLGGASVTHDARGNLTTDGRDRLLSYSSENLLTRYTRLSDGGVGVLGYDPLMRFQDSNPGSASRRAFFYDGHTVVAEYGASGLLGKHVHGPGQDEPLFTLQSNGLRVWYHADERGSVVAVSNADGTARAVNTYDEYGKTNHGWGRFLYTGQPQLFDDMLYARSRIYDTGSGRFFQTDRIGYGDGMNLYGYVGGDPVNYTDPSGLAQAQPRCSGEHDVCGRRPDRHHTDFMNRMAWDNMNPSPADHLPGGPCATAGRGSMRFCTADQPADEEEEIVVTSNCNATCRANLRELERQKDNRWVLMNARYVFNPFYVRPWYDFGLDGFLGAQLTIGSLAITPGVAALTARGTGLLNRNNFVRLGYNWKGGARDGKQVFRVGVGKRRWHFDLIE